MREKIVAGNWKMNTTLKEGKKLIEEILSGTDRIPQDVTLIIAPPFTHCLLYTSDAADDLLCVDLGSRRIIKKKNKIPACPTISHHHFT